MCLQTRLQWGILRNRSVFITVFRFSPGSGILLAYSTDINSFQMCVYIYIYIYLKANNRGEMISTLIWSRYIFLMNVNW